ncbi:cytochrome b/b6 domain-containing protein [Massilia sp. Mn16-1_5]|uniref:cytochrome b/b6 domain-containing protein n=1 Tax=Massilia sp. Mn16-1_5 TaxID=2079199 RepID=UPI001B347A8E|nr:cytochrome b/b6 domain-containing protein [Massilia sp. Mn16-1_5]
MIRRHSLPTRLTHWLNAVCLCFLLASGLQIFNAWPQLYWGQAGAEAGDAVLEIGTTTTHGDAAGFLRIGAISLTTTGVLGVSHSGADQVRRAFPGWLTLPAYQHLAAGRQWHFLFAWCFVLNGLAYLAWSLFSGHLRRDLMPRRGELRPAHLWHEVVEHARLRFPKDERARHYNALQKLSYLGVIGVLLPLMVLTGLTMSPGVGAACPWLLDLFGGRQSARTLHFITASFLVLFVVVHIAMVIVSGLWNNLRSMVTGRYAITKESIHE